jgi:MFS transporter, DHA1 family, multidrug resistance protein
MIAMFGFSLFCFACATAKDLQTLMICRFFTGVFGSCPLAVVAAVFSDMFDNTQRGAAIVIFSSTVFLGPMFGPFIGGFINKNSSLGWRWNLYIPGILGAAADVLVILFVHESYAPIVLVSKAKELRRRTKNWGIHAKQEEVEVDFRELITKNFSRPIRLLVTEPIILAITCYMSLIYGLLYCFLTAYPLVFQGVHHITPGVAGLPFFGMMCGIFLVAGYIIWDSKGYNKKLAANGGIPVPEWRLPPVMIGGVLFTLGLFWFGWTGYKASIHWIVPTLSGLFTGFGLLAIFICCFNYIIDSYLMFAASAIAANTFLRSILAAAFPLFSRQMFDNLGIQWAGTLLGCLAGICVPIPVLFYFYGKKLRQKSKFAPTMKAKKDDVEENSDDSDDHDNSMAALHATRSRAHHDSDTGIRARTRTNGSAATAPGNDVPATDPEKRAV